MSPEKCHYDAGTCREPDWAQSHCFVDHIVYLANTSGVKVGITRHSQVPTRWMDQGATQAQPIARVQHRQLSGLLETALAKHVKDKTAWQTMLKGNGEAVSLEEKRQELMSLCEGDIQALQDRFGLQHCNCSKMSRRSASTIQWSNFPLKSARIILIRIRWLRAN